MSTHRNPRPRLAKPRSTDNSAPRRRSSKKNRWPKFPESLVRKHGVELAHKAVHNANAARPLNVILDVLRTVDRRQAMRLIEAVGALVTFATKGAQEP
jgi:hypothetical protein